MRSYLYKKTHNKTGLQYLGKTIREDYEVYQGSGVKWREHIAEHGYDVTTELVRVCETDADLRKYGKYYTKLWNVVDDPNWANLKEEAGPGGGLSEETKSKISKGMKKTLSKLTKEERSQRMKNSACKEYTPERLEKARQGMLGKKKTRTPAFIEAHAKRVAGIKANPKKCGDANRGKTWKLIDGKRVWMEKA